MRRLFDNLQLEPGIGRVARGDGALIAGISEQAWLPRDPTLDPTAGLS